MSPAPHAEPPLETEQLKRVVEAIVFANDGPVTIDMLGEALPAEGAEAIREALDSLSRDYQSAGHSFEILRIAGGYQICTRELYANWVVRFQRGNRRARLSRAAVETLAIIAYRQPITRTEMEEIRGVDSGAVLHTLLERNLITVRGRSRGIGRPLLYATTSEFLEYFGLDRLEDLPRLDEIESLLKEREELPEEFLELEDNRLPVAAGEEAGESTASAHAGATDLAPDRAPDSPPPAVASGGSQDLEADNPLDMTDPDLDELQDWADDERSEVTAGPGLFRSSATAGTGDNPEPDVHPTASPPDPAAQEDSDDAAIELERLD